MKAPPGRGNKCPNCQTPLTHADAEYVRNRKVVLQGGPQCHWCAQEQATTADHVVPLAGGGTHALDNLVPACSTCNAARRDRPGPPPNATTRRSRSAPVTSTPVRLT